MGEMQRLRTARGKRVLEVTPGGDRSGVVVTIRIGSGKVSAVLDNNEREALIKALGGETLPNVDHADRLANGAYKR